LNYEDGEPSGAVKFIDEIPKSLSTRSCGVLMERDPQAAGSPPD
jgi:hypothetical protein